MEIHPGLQIVPADLKGYLFGAENGYLICYTSTMLGGRGNVG